MSKNNFDAAPEQTQTPTASSQPSLAEEARRTYGPDPSIHASNNPFIQDCNALMAPNAPNALNALMALNASNASNALQRDAGPGKAALRKRKRE